MRSFGKFAVLISVTVLLLAVLLDRLYPPDLSRYQQRSRLVVDVEGNLLRGFTSDDDTWRLPLQPEAVDPLFLAMLTSYEDRRFEYHPGIDPLAMVRALGQWISYGRIVSGASTLTMQTARLLEPRPRNWQRKLFEIARAIQLEWHFDKNEILAMYLTLAPYGGNLEGLRAASWAYLGKEPSRLTPAEAALLVVLPQAPSRLRPDRHPARARAARDKVLQRVMQRGVLSAQQIHEAEQESLPKRRQDMPFIAPHLARRLVAADSGQEVLSTTLDGSLQRTLETLARREQSQLPPQANIAILVVANPDRRVLAYVASADFFSERSAGQVDMITAVRSPGSTLKPLIYGIGFDDLLIHPQTLLTDIPMHFGEYTPSNFSDTFRGEVSVREALQRSLNIPAVVILEQIGPTRVIARLRACGITLQWRNDEKSPGLPLVLGGVGIDLEDLVMLYAGIADAGRVLPLRYQIDQTEALPRRLLSPAAAWYLGEILADTPPPAQVVARDNARSARRIAFKTGTSYGFRDAWAIGYDADHTVGIWVGRPDGSPSPGHYGHNTAAPLLFRVFDSLPEPQDRNPSPVPKGVIVASNADLPPRLRRLQVTDSSAAGKSSTPRIRFPLDGSTVELALHDSHLESLPLIAEGGERPLRWLVNGLPIRSSRRRRDADWQPDGIGFARITVIDAHGRSANANIWVANIEAGEDG